MDLVLLDHKIISESMKLYKKEWWGTACFYLCNKEMLQELLRCHVQQVCYVCNFCETCSDVKDFAK